MGVLQQVTVEPIRFIFTMALAMQYQATRELVLRKVCLSARNQTLCGTDEDPDSETSLDGQTVQEEVATWCFYLDTSVNLLGALVSCVYGSASDRFGRRGFLVLPSLGLMLGSATYFLHYYFLQLPLYYLFFSSALMGLFGYYQASYIGTMSVICDITDHSDRSFRLGVMESMGMISGSIGMVLAWVLLSINYDGLVILIIILSQGAVFIYVRYWLKETADAGSFQEVDSQDASCSCSPRRICSDVSWSVRRTLMVYVIWRTENRRQLLLINQTVGILSSLRSSGERDLTRLYTSSPPLSWADSTLLAYFSVKDAVKGMILAVGIPLLFLYTSHWTIRFDMIVAMMTSLSTLASLVLRAFALSTPMMMLVPVVGCLGGFPNTLISSIKCKLVDSNEFGALFACTMLIQSICHVAGRVFFRWLYTATLKIWPRLPFLGMGIFFVLLLSIITYMWCLSGHLSKKDKTDPRQQLINAYDGSEEDTGLFSAKTK